MSKFNLLLRTISFCLGTSFNTRINKKTNKNYTRHEHNNSTCELYFDCSEFNLLSTGTIIKPKITPGNIQWIYLT